MRSLGMAVSSEEPADCFVPYLDFVHWNGYPRTPTMVGDHVGIPVPLGTLVYHDPLLTHALYDYRSSKECTVLFGGAVTGPDPLRPDRLGGRRVFRKGGSPGAAARGLGHA